MHTHVRPPVHLKRNLFLRDCSDFSRNRSSGRRLRAPFAAFRGRNCSDFNVPPLRLRRMGIMSEFSTLNFTSERRGRDERREFQQLQHCVSAIMHRMWMNNEENVFEIWCMSVRRGNEGGNTWFTDSFDILQVSHCCFVWISRFSLSQLFVRRGFGEHCEREDDRELPASELRRNSDEATETFLPFFGIKFFRILSSLERLLRKRYRKYFLQVLSYQFPFTFGLIAVGMESHAPRSAAIPSKEWKIFRRSERSNSESKLWHSESSAAGTRQPEASLINHTEGSWRYGGNFSLISSRVGIERAQKFPII